MLRALFHTLRKPTVPHSAFLHRSVERTSTRNAQFISFLDNSGFRRVDTDKWERKMRRQRLVAYALLWTMVAGFAWVVIESAQALSLF
jgi:hypothetical protein